MITLADEFTDRKERRARGWLFFDAGCRFCTRFARWLAPALARRGLGVAPLGDPRVGVLLGLSRDELLRELRFLDSAGIAWSGAQAVVALAREFWWGRPLVWAARLPGAAPALANAYRRLAARRGCRAAPDADRLACGAARPGDLGASPG